MIEKSSVIAMSNDAGPYGMVTSKSVPRAAKWSLPYQILLKLVQVVDRIKKQTCIKYMYINGCNECKFIKFIWPNIFTHIGFLVQSICSILLQEHYIYLKDLNTTIFGKLTNWYIQQNIVKGWTLYRWHTSNIFDCL